MSMSIYVSTPDAPNAIIYENSGSNRTLGRLALTIPEIPDTLDVDVDTGTTTHHTTAEQFKQWYHATQDAPGYFSDLYEHVTTHPEITVLRFEKMY